jgi:hypothetical protein
MSNDKHGLFRLKAALKLRGWSGIDGRSLGAKQLFSWRSELVSSLGGERNLTPQRKAIIETVCRTRLFLDTLDIWLMGQPSLLLVRKRTILPALRERQSLADSLLRHLQALGLERVAVPIPSLQDYLREREREMAVQDAPQGDSSDVAGTGRAIAPSDGEVSP